MTLDRPRLYNNHVSRTCLSAIINPRRVRVADEPLRRETRSRARSSSPIIALSLNRDAFTIRPFPSPNVVVVFVERFPLGRACHLRRCTGTERDGSASLSVLTGKYLSRHTPPPSTTTSVVAVAVVAVTTAAATAPPLPLRRRNHPARTRSRAKTDPYPRSVESRFRAATLK